MWQQPYFRIDTRDLFDGMPRRLIVALFTGKAIHTQRLKLGFYTKGMVGNTIVSLRAKRGDVGYAEKAFDLLDRRDAPSWNSILYMHSRLGFPVRALKTLKSMHRSQVFVDEFGYSISLSACAKLIHVQFGRQVHCGILKTGFQSNSYCEGALVDMYAKCHAVADARRVYDGVENRGMVSWTAMLSGYVREGLRDEALKLFDEIKSFGHKLDQVASITVINMCLGLGRFADACELFLQMGRPHVVAWNVMISGHAKKGYEREAIEFFKQMRRSGVKSTRATLGSVLSAIGVVSALDLGMLVHAEATKQGLTSNVYVGSSLISMYAKCGKIEFAKSVFDTSEEKNIVIWNAMLGGYAQNGFGVQVLDLFSDMSCSGFGPDDFSFTSVLCACASLGYLETGRQLHSVSIKKKLSCNLFVGNALVDMYTKCGDIQEARKQFDRINNWDNVSWNSIIVGYVQQGEEKEAFKLLGRRMLCGIVPDEACVASILSACANITSLSMGKQLHCFSVKSNLESSVYAGSSLIDMYVKCGSMVDAQKVFYLMPKRSVVSFNALIAGYAQKNLDEALILLRCMRIEELEPSEVTVASLLDSCMLRLGSQLHGLVLKTGLPTQDEFLGVSLMGMYMDSCRTAEACSLFAEFSSPKSRVLWTAIISGHSQKDLNREALQFYGQMRRDGALPDQATFVSTLRACSVLVSLNEGKAIHALIFRTNYSQDEATQGALMDMYAKCGDVTSLAQAFEEMSSKLHVVSWNSVIVGFAKNGYADDSLRVFEEMRQMDVAPDEVTFLGVLTACSHGGKVCEGREMFDSMVNCYGLKPRADHCACMIDMLGRYGHLDEAQKLITKHHMESDAKVWASLLGACRLHGDDVRGCIAAEKLIELEPHNASPYVLLSNIYASQGNYHKVNALRGVMRVRGVRKVPGCSWIHISNTNHIFVAGDNSHPHRHHIVAALNCLSKTMRKPFYYHDIIIPCFT